jgi:alpha-glucosidase (family GH31 glycosyl hydrolase)
MVKRLHELGFKVMLWVCPFVRPDSQTFRMLEAKGYLLKDSKGCTAVRRWWNGYSAELDCTNPGAVDWLCSELDGLVRDYGIDGFKFDAGDPEYYENDDISNIPTDRNGHCEAWAKLGLKYGLNEYRACWKMAGTRLVQRLRDKFHSWGEDGLASLIPDGLAQSLAGYAFNCPDMIGGGDYSCFTDENALLDQELIVRYAQCSALFPMMQFSIAPWRVLSNENLNFCIAAANLHARLGGEILKLAENAARSGEPIMRHMAYEFPGCGYENIKDQFMLGADILVSCNHKGSR